MATTTAVNDVLTDDLLERFDARAMAYDRENRFFAEDFEDLVKAGYLDLALPEDRGGRGASIAEIVAANRRLAFVAPATSVACNMHLYWVGIAADLARVGDSRGKFILDAAAEGKVLASGHGERGNDIPGLFSSTNARRVEGGWRLNGHKIFGSLSPVWDFMGLHAMDVSEPEAPRVVHGFVSRDAEGLRVVETWDALGMRATASHDTTLDDVFLPDEQVISVCPAGFGGADAYIVALFAWAELTLSGVYLGAAERAYEETIKSVQKKTAVAMTRSMAYHPEVQHNVAEMRMLLESASALLERMAIDWTAGVDHGIDWIVKLVTTKHVVTTNAWQAVDLAIDVAGGGGVLKRNRLEQLFRDVRMGRIHPANPLFTHEVVGKLSLGVDPDEQPRWG
jgi:alkylation response protein AidB-like acyl-CoA dehydrogenase